MSNELKIIIGTKIKFKCYEFGLNKSNNPYDVVETEDKYVFGEVHKVVDDGLVELRFYDPRFENRIVMINELILV